MKREKIEQLTTIFSDCAVVDIDMTRWFSCIDVWLLSDHYHIVSSDFAPSLLLVRFANVKKLSVEFNHDFNWSKRTGKVFRWNIDTFNLSPYSNQDDVECKFTTIDKTMPSTVIVCEDIIVKIKSKEICKKFFPSAFKPGSTLLRPGVEDILDGDGR